MEPVHPPESAAHPHQQQGDPGEPYRHDRWQRRGKTRVDCVHRVADDERVVDRRNVSEFTAAARSARSKGSLVRPACQRTVAVTMGAASSTAKPPHATA